MSKLKKLVQAATDAGTSNSQPDASVTTATQNPSSGVADLNTPSLTLTQAAKDAGIGEPQTTTPGSSDPAPQPETEPEGATSTGTALSDSAAQPEAPSVREELEPEDSAPTASPALSDSTAQPEAPSEAAVTAATSPDSDPVPDKTPRILTRVYLLPNESLDEYEDLRLQLFDVLKPRDIIEEMYAREFVQRTWEILRERRLASGLIAFHATETLENILFRRYRIDNLQQLIAAWFKSEPAATQRVKKFLEGIGLNIPAVMAKATANAINDLERLDAMTARKELRRNAIPREIERHRAVLEQQKKSTTQVVDAEFKVIEPATQLRQLVAQSDVDPSANTPNDGRTRKTS
jgi:hypothetical protein